MCAKCRQGCREIYTRSQVASYLGSVSRHSACDLGSSAPRAIVSDSTLLTVTGNQMVFDHALINVRQARSGEPRWRRPDEFISKSPGCRQGTILAPVAERQLLPCSGRLWDHIWP
jgi:hypothetical protein